MNNIIGKVVHDPTLAGIPNTTAYYDFHNLQIAFKHVWKEATDAGIIAQGAPGFSEDPFRERMEPMGRPHRTDDAEGRPLTGRRSDREMFSMGGAR